MAADFLIGGGMYNPSLGCDAPFLRNMMDPQADGGYSYSCWYPSVDETVSRLRVVPRWRTRGCLHPFVWFEGTFSSADAGE